MFVTAVRILFPKIFEICSEGQTNVSQHFPNIFVHFTKITEDYRRLPKTTEEDPKMFRSYTNKFYDIWKHNREMLSNMTTWLSYFFQIGPIFKGKSYLKLSKLSLCWQYWINWLLYNFIKFIKFINNSWRSKPIQKCNLSHMNTTVNPIQIALK